jgi:hypothetical protein
LILMTGCSWFEPKKRTQGILNAQVNPWFGARVPIRVQAYLRDKNGKREVVSTHEAPSDGTVSFGFLWAPPIRELKAKLEADGRGRIRASAKMKAEMGMVENAEHWAR